MHHSAVRSHLKELIIWSHFQFNVICNVACFFLHLWSMEGTHRNYDTLCYTLWYIVNWYIVIHSVFPKNIIYVKREKICIRETAWKFNLWSNWFNYQELPNWCDLNHYANVYHVWCKKDTITEHHLLFWHCFVNYC